MAGGTHDLLLHAEQPDESAMPLPLMQRLKIEEELHAMDIQKLRSEQVARQLKIECKEANRARRKEEKTSQQLRVECAALVQRLNTVQPLHQQLVRQHEELAQTNALQAKKLAKLTAQHKEEAGQVAAQREMLHRADERAAEQQQQILQLSVAAEQERARTEAQERATQAAEQELIGRNAELVASETRLAEAKAQLELRTSEASWWLKGRDAAEVRAAASAEARAGAEALLQVRGGTSRPPAVLSLYLVRTFSLSAHTHAHAPLTHTLQWTCILYTRQRLEQQDAAAHKVESEAAEQRRAHDIAQACSRRRAATHYLRHWAALRAAYAFQRWLSFALEDELRLAAVDWCSLTVAHDESGAALAGERAAKEQVIMLGRIATLQARTCHAHAHAMRMHMPGTCTCHAHAHATHMHMPSMLSALQVSRMGEELLRQQAAVCFGRWAQCARAHEACRARWCALVRAAELAPWLGARGWRVQLRTRVRGEAARRARSLWRVQRVFFNTQTMRRTIFALWRMWAQGTLLHEWARASEARQASLHFGETKWWLEQ